MKQKNEMKWNDEEENDDKEDDDYNQWSVPGHWATLLSNSIADRTKRKTNDKLELNWNKATTNHD